MKVSELMTQQVRVVAPEDTIQRAAMAMAELDAGVLPVAEKDRLVGMITDRDVAVRAVAKGRHPDTKVRDVMSPEVRYCFEDEDVTHVARNMGEIQVRRLPVVDRAKRLVGILSLGDIAMGSDASQAHLAVAGISRPGGKHSQTPA